jgi:predicted alpha-1,6-mannanase (GH76 family)
MHLPSHSVIALFLLLLPLSTSTPDYVSHASQAFDVLQTWYNQTTGLWDTMGWWNAANGLTTIAHLAGLDPRQQHAASAIFAHTYSHAPPYNPRNNLRKIATLTSISTLYGPPSHFPRRPKRARFTPPNAADWTDSCYDDNGWWALAWLAAYDTTNTPSYLALGEAIFSQMASGGPTNCGAGGIIWCADQPYYVNAIANELYLSVAAHLAARVPSSAGYLAAAKAQWAWFRASGMINADGLVNDGLTPGCENNGATAWSYNQGVILGALAELARADARNSSASAGYLAAAHALARASIRNLTDASGVVHETCEPSCGADGTQFKGAYVRGLAALHRASPKALYRRIILANADAIWAKDRDVVGRLSVDWAGPFVAPANASTHSSALDALVAAVAAA